MLPFYTKSVNKPVAMLLKINLLLLMLLNYLVTYFISNNNAVYMHLHKEME